jgi:hypothetical protein
MLSEHERKGKGRRKLGGELQMLDQQSIGCQLTKMNHRHTDVTNDALALA